MSPSIASLEDNRASLRQGSAGQSQARAALNAQARQAVDVIDMCLPFPSFPPDSASIVAGLRYMKIRHDHHCRILVPTWATV